MNQQITSYTEFTFQAKERKKTSLGRILLFLKNKVQEFSVCLLVSVLGVLFDCFGGGCIYLFVLFVSVLECGYQPKSL